MEFRHTNQIHLGTYTYLPRYRVGTSRNVSSLNPRAAGEKKVKPKRLVKKKEKEKRRKKENRPFMANIYSLGKSRLSELRFNHAR